MFEMNHWVEGVRQGARNLSIALSPVVAAAAQDKPNILIIWGDDIGQSNISAYTMGLVG